MSKDFGHRKNAREWSLRLSMVMDPSSNPRACASCVCVMFQLLSEVESSCALQRHTSSVSENRGNRYAMDAGWQATHCCKQPEAVYKTRPDLRR